MEQENISNCWRHVKRLTHSYTLHWIIFYHFTIAPSTPNITPPTLPPLPPSYKRKTPHQTPNTPSKHSKHTHDTPVAVVTPSRVSAAQARNGTQPKPPRDARRAPQKSPHNRLQSSLHTAQRAAHQPAAHRKIFHCAALRTRLLQCELLLHGSPGRLPDPSVGCGRLFISNRECFQW